eukprot:gene13441-15840_t
MATPPATLQEGMGVWVPDQQLEWIAVEVVSQNDNEVVVRTEDGEREMTVQHSKVFLKNPDILEGIDDLAALSYLHEPAILHNLHHRYNLNQIYTYIGKILIAINPYTSLPLYGREMISAYYGKQLGALSPHVYAVAEDAFKDMRYDGASQSILVSGESGAGKTETTKFILQYFAAMGNLIKSSGSGQPGLSTSSSSIPASPLSPPASSTGAKKPASEKSIEERVLESTPLLEAFGNAKTLRNDNSSRFGKFIEIHFNEMGSIIGAKILTYLLEKSRLVRQVYNERNYHIFYQLLAGAPDDMRERLLLLQPEDYTYLNQSQCFEIEGVDDTHHFQKTCHAMSVAGITTQEQEFVFKIISVVLLLGNVAFEDAPNDSSTICDGDALENACSLLGCTRDEMAKTFLTRKVVTGKEHFITANTRDRAENARDSLAMLLYGLMFEWLVVKINASMAITAKSKSFIGILDIYGFESFEVNGFEQFCINYANEKLQQVFNQHVFKEEQQEYIKEKIDWSYIDFNDNQDTLDLIEKRPMCVLSLLDEESMFPKATAQTFATKLYSKLSAAPKFEKPRFSSTAFTINHYAGKVTYETDQFLDKNKDFMIPEQILVLQKASFGFIKVLLSGSERTGAGSGPPTPSNKPAAASSSSSMKFSSVGSQFSASLATLMRTIATTTPHYIRCIKPNPDKLPQTFNKHDVIHQLRCGGVMESVRICCAGFPTRRPLGDFYSRYRILYTKAKKAKDAKANVAALLEGIELSDDKYKIGQTKVFLRAGQLASLENMRMGKLNHSATVIQTSWRRFFYERKYRALRSAALTLQTRMRAGVARGRLVVLQRGHAATRIQAAYRGYKARVAYRAKREAAMTLQTALRKMSCRHIMQVNRVESAAIALQTVLRAGAARILRDKGLRGIIALQAKWRGKMARKIYSAMRAEARSLRSVQDAKNKLQEKLEEIQWRLTAEQRGKAHAEEAKVRLEKAVEELTYQRDHLQLAASDAAARVASLEEATRSQEVDGAEMSRQLADKSEALDNALANIKRLEKERSDATERATKSEADMELVNANVARLQESYDALMAAHTALKSETSERISTLESQLADKIKEADASSQELASVKRSYEKAQEEIHTLNDLKDSLQSSFDTAVEENTQMKDAFEALKTENSATVDEMKNVVEVELAKTKETGVKMQADLEALQAKHTTEAAQWRTSDESLRAQVNTLVNQGDELRTKLTAKETANAELAEKFKKLKNKLESAQEEKKNVGVDYEKLKMARSMVEEEKGSLMQQLQSIKIEKEALVTSTQSLKEKNSSIKAALETAQLDLNRMRNESSVRDEAAARMSAEATELRATTARQARELAEATLERSKAEHASAAVERTAESHRTESERLATALKLNERDLTTARDTNTRLEMEIKQLSALKERFESEFFVAKEKNSSSVQESAYLKEVTAQMQANASRLEKELEERKSVVNRLEDEKDAAKKQVEQLQTAIETSRGQLATATAAIDELKRTKAKNKERSSALTGQLEAAMAEIVSLKNAGSVSVKALTDAENNAKKIKEKHSELKRSSAQTKEAKLKMESELAMAQNKAQWIETAFNELKSRNAELSELNALSKSATSASSAEAERAIATRDAEIASLKAKISEIQDSFTVEIAGLRAASEELTKTAAAMTLENEKLATENREMEENTVTLTNQLMSHKLENDSLKQQAFEEKKSRRKSVEIQQFLEDTKSTQMSEITELRTTVQSMSVERDQMARQIEQLLAQKNASEAAANKAKTMCSEAVIRLKSFHQLEEIIDYKETDWEKLARIAGNQETQTKLLSDYLLSCKLEHSTLAGQMWFHQLVYWRSFERDNSLIFKGIIKSILGFSLAHYDELDLLSYLLSCTSLLLYVFKEKLKTLKANEFVTPSIPSVTELEEIDGQLVGVKPMASSDFVIQLQQSVGRSFGMLFRIVTTKLQPILDGAILNENYNVKKPVANGHSQPLMQMDHITSYLFSIISIFQHRMIHFTLSQPFFNQVFCWIGAIMLKAFMLRKEFCKEDFANHLKGKLDVLIKWANEIGDVWVGPVDNAFAQVKEAIAVLTMKDKEKLTEEKLRKTLCPSLNPNQLKQLLVMYTPGEFGKKVSASTINAVCPANKSMVGQSFMVDETKLSNIPISNLHYLWPEDIQNISIPLSIRYSIEREIKSISLQIEQSE